MKRHAVSFTARAEAELREAVAFWESQGARGLFASELASTLAELTETPKIAPLFLPRAERGVRRALLRRTKQHVYYRVDDEPRRIVILAIWHARRPDPDL